MTNPIETISRVNREIDEMCSTSFEDAIEHTPLPAIFSVDANYTFTDDRDAQDDNQEVE